MGCLEFLDGEISWQMSSRSMKVLEYLRLASCGGNCAVRRGWKAGGARGIGTEPACHVVDGI